VGELEGGDGFIWTDGQRYRALGHSNRSGPDPVINVFNRGGGESPRFEKIGLRVLGVLSEGLTDKGLGGITKPPAKKRQAERESASATIEQFAGRTNVGNEK